MGRNKVVRPNKIFTVGDESCDFTQDEITLLEHKLSIWFQSEECDRNYEYPMEAAKKIVHNCLLGLNNDGTQWLQAPDTFQSRIKAKALWDMDNDRGKSVARIKNPIARKKHTPEVVKTALKTQMDKVDAMRATFNEQQFTDTKVGEILNSYPELDSPAHRPNVERLAILYAQQELIRIQLMLTDRIQDRMEGVRALKDITSTIEVLMKSLDIHPDQMRKRMDQQKDGTLGELVALMDGDDYFLERERQWALQLALQLWWAHSHPNGKGDGPNLELFEIWHATRSRPISFTCGGCGKHYDALVEGFTPKELKEYLIRRGVLVEESVLPGLIDNARLIGLAEYDESTSGNSAVREDASSYDRGGHNPPNSAIEGETS